MSSPNTTDLPLSDIFTMVPFINRRHLEVLQQLLQRRLAVLGFVILLTVVLMAIFAPAIAPQDPTERNFAEANEPPSLDHPLGTDSFGRDVFSRLLFGAQSSLYVGFMIPIISATIGVPFGLIAGYYSNTLLDTILMRIADTILSFPGIILALTIMAILGGSINNVIIALSITNTPIMARLVRGSVLSVKEEEYVANAEAAGSTDTKIILGHVLPNVTAPIIVQATLVFAFSILNEATLSFLGVGTQPPTPSWGLMLREGKRYLSQAPWIAFSAGLAIMITVLSLNFLGDALRDVLDPKHTEERTQ
jgi:peptide/nickel transport system permease protein